jgi:hypothetical protein
MSVPTLPVFMGSMMSASVVAISRSGRHCLQTLLASVDVITQEKVVGSGRESTHLEEPNEVSAEITAICTAARELFLSQPALLELSAPVKIVGDVVDVITQEKVVGSGRESTHLEEPNEVSVLAVNVADT